MSLNITLKHDNKTRQLNIWFSKMEKLKTIHCTCLKRNTDQASDKHLPTIRKCIIIKNLKTIKTCLSSGW